MLLCSLNGFSPHLTAKSTPAAAKFLCVQILRAKTNTATIRPHMNLRDAARVVKMEIEDFAREINVRRGKRRVFSLGEDGLFRVFGTLGRVIVPGSTVEAFAKKRGFEIVHDKTHLIPEVAPEASNCVRRQGVVGVLGHVDHGKTTLIDTLQERPAKRGEAAREAGKITQKVRMTTMRLDKNLHEDKQSELTLIDTPGHSTFFRMRSHVASIVDILLVVVDAGEGLQPQTAEVLNYASLQNIPVLFAINKIDIHAKLVPRTLTQLTKECLKRKVKFECANVSALTGEGIPEMILQLRTMLNKLQLLGDPKYKNGHSTVVEVESMRGVGSRLHVLCHAGTLRCGEWFLVCDHVSRVRAMQACDLKYAAQISGKKISAVDAALPGQCAAIIASGDWEGVVPGDTLHLIKKEIAVKIAEARKLELMYEAAEILDPSTVPWPVLRSLGIPIPEENQTSDPEATDAEEEAQSDDEEEMIAVEEGKVLNCVLRADTEGSLCSLMDAFEETAGRLGFGVRLVVQEVGPPSIHDVRVASAAGPGVSAVFAFNTSVPQAVTEIAKKHNVRIYRHDVFVHLLKDLQAHLRKMSNITDAT